MPGLVHPSSEACESISARLSGVEDLRLPAALLRQHPYPDSSCVREHLQELLQRDAAVFLERYGMLLLPEERQSFEPLRQHYEIDFFLKQAEAAQQQRQAHQQQHQPQQQQHRQRQHLSSTVKNRRLAFMRRLEAGGEYFSEHAMREREPLVWQECIGRHEGHPAVATAAAAAGGDRSFASSLLASYDEAMLQARLQQQMEDEEAAMSEHESDSDSDTDAVVGADGRQQHQQQQEQGQGGPAAGAAAVVQPRPSAISTPAAAAAGRTQDAARARAAADDAAAAAAAQDPHQQQQQQQPGARRAGVDMGPGAMARRRQEFLLEMQHRFLDGLDGEHQDYAAIDADVGLDEDWSKQQAQDAEDAYFDAD